MARRFFTEADIRRLVREEGRSELVLEPRDVLTALALEPDAVDLQEMLIAELLAAGRLSEARQQYESCRVALRRYLDMEPSPRTRMLTRLLY